MVTMDVPSHIEPVDPLGLDFPSLVAQFRKRWDKGEYHASSTRLTELLRSLQAAVEQQDPPQGAST